MSGLQGQSQLMIQESGNSGAALPTTRVVLADESLRMRSAVVEVLRSGYEVAIVGHPLMVRRPIEAVDRLRPDILILDVIMSWTVFGYTHVEASEFADENHRIDFCYGSVFAAGSYGSGRP